MQHIVEILSAGSWPEALATETFAADYEGRHRRRMVIFLKSGEKVLLDLEHARLLHAGDGLKLEDGRIILVKSLSEELMEVTAQNSLHLLRLAWHIGNRHLPAAIEEHRILVRYDHVIADMIRGLGGHVHMVTAAFNPESGAYAGRIEAHHHENGHTHHSHD